MHSTDYAVVRYPSVCPYDYARWCINNILKLFFTFCVPFSYKTIWQTSNGVLLKGCRVQAGYEKMRILTNISFYLRNDTN